MTLKINFRYVFIFGSLLLLVTALVLPNYSNYVEASRNRQQYLEFMNSDTIKLIEKAILQKAKIEPKHTKNFIVLESGMIIYRLNYDEQIIVLEPKTEPLKTDDTHDTNDSVTWQCYGSSSINTPYPCRFKAP